jgi:hypothetical protein
MLRSLNIMSNHLNGSGAWARLPLLLALLSASLW